MLIRRRLGVLNELISTYKLDFDISLVASATNRADALTRVPMKWLKPNYTERISEVSCGATSQTSHADISDVHKLTGHQGIDRTLYFARRKDPSVSKTAVRDVVRACQLCQSIDPSPQSWENGTLQVDDLWERVSIDITHVNGAHYLTLIDCGPSRFTIWRRLRSQNSVSVIEHFF